MKTPEEYLLDGLTEDQYFDQEDPRLSFSQYGELEEVIKQVQKDTYNQALEDAVENVTLLEEGVDIGKEYLMQQYNTFYRDVLFNINNQSILKLKIK